MAVKNVVRLCARRWAETAFSGEGAVRREGRWNSKGTRLVYTAGSLSLAQLEMLVHFDSEDAPEDLVSVAATFPESLCGAASSLPREWRKSEHVTRECGDAWVERGASAVLRVPSAVSDGEFNYLINPRHPDFPSILLYEPKPFRFDPRLLPPTS